MEIFRWKFPHDPGPSQNRHTLRKSTEFETESEVSPVFSDRLGTADKLAEAKGPSWFAMRTRSHAVP